MTGYVLLAGAFAFLAYAFVGYPLVLRLWPAARSRAPAGAAPAEPPSITITVPVYNEAGQVRELIEGLLALDHPADRRQILIVSDASTDGTDEIVKEYAAVGVELLRVPRRGGKSAIENVARPHIRGEIVVNTDASIRFAPGALAALLAPFADPTVGVVSGRDVSVTRVGADANVGESSYVDYEMRIRDLETRSGGIVGASGCFYAIRRELHLTEVPAGLSRDFSAALIARERGFAAVSARDAVCFVPRTPSLRAEYRRKVRTTARGLRTLFHRAHLLNPVRHGVFAWKLFSHKLCRWLIPWAGIAIAAALTLIAAGGAAWAAWLLLLGILGLAPAAVAWYWPESRPIPRLLALPAFAALSNVAVLHAWMRLFAGRTDATWEPTRRRADDAPRTRNEGAAARSGA